MAACLAWALDNNLTRKVSISDPVQITLLKGLVAGSVNLALAPSIGSALPSAPTIMAAGLVGLLGYGLSLVLFVSALRRIGTARTGAYYSVAPFVGAALAILVLAEPLNVQFVAAGAVMAMGVWLHLTERHEHSHRPHAAPGARAQVRAG